jgi:hypothetical protein
VILMRSALLYSKVSHFSDRLVKYKCPFRCRERPRGGEQVERHHGTGWCDWSGSRRDGFIPGEVPLVPIE